MLSHGPIGLMKLVNNYGRQAKENIKDYRLEPPACGL